MHIQIDEYCIRSNQLFVPVPENSKQMTSLCPINVSYELSLSG